MRSEGRRKNSPEICTVTPGRGSLERLSPFKRPNNSMVPPLRVRLLIIFLIVCLSLFLSLSNARSGIALTPIAVVCNPW